MLLSMMYSILIYTVEGNVYNIAYRNSTYII